jgi:FtsP/CotA-like multicopper oxidase with cupredoxin domain
MKLIKEKPKSVKQPTVKKDDEIPVPFKDTTIKADKMDNIDMPKEKPQLIKTIVNNTPPHTVRYDLYITDTMVNFSGKSKRAIAVNGQIPMPTLTFTEGDTAEIYVHNELNEETSLHWHGLFLPNQYDGVPNLTQMPIKPHTTHLYKFPIIQHGTHWYHSHTRLQEQIGMYGMFIMNKRVPSAWERAEGEARYEARRNTPQLTQCHGLVRYKKRNNPKLYRSHKRQASKNKTYQRMETDECNGCKRCVL